MTVIFVLLLCVTVGVTAVALFSRGETIPASAFPDVEGLDVRAAAAPTQRFFPAKLNAPDVFSYQINGAPTFRIGGTGDLLIENPAANRYLMAVELVLDSSDEVVLRTGYLKPGQTLKSVPLDTPLAAGTYAVTACFCAVAPGTLELLGILEQPITLTVAA
ncbi:MAG: hypothetical protein RR320_01000 [Oscillospiraceae bacterium]